MSLFKTIRVSAWTALGGEVAVVLIATALGHYSGPVAAVLVPAMLSTAGICFSLEVAQMLITGKALSKFGSTYTRSDQPISYWMTVSFVTMGVCGCLVGIWSLVVHPNGVTSRPVLHSASMPTTSPDSVKVTIDQSSPKALMLSIHRAVEADDYEAIVRCHDPAMKPFMDAALEIQQTTRHAYHVMDNRLGKGADEFKTFAFFCNPVPDSVLVSAIVDPKTDWNRIKVNEKGDAADIVVADTTVKARRIEGKWYFMGVSEHSKEDIRKATDFLVTILVAYKIEVAKLENGLEDGTITQDNIDGHLWALEDELQRKMEASRGATKHH